MGIVAITGNIISRQYSIYTAISFSFIAQILINPLVIYDSGFILSYLGTLGIILLFPKINKFLLEKLDNYKENAFVKYTISTLSVTLSAQIILIPIMLYLYNTFNTLSLISNLILTLFITPIILLAIIVYLLSFKLTFTSIGLSNTLYVIIFVFLNITHKLASFTFSSIVISTPNISIMISYYLLVIYFFTGKKYKIISRISYFIISINLLILILPNNHIKINQIYVGQGDAMLIQTIHKKNILVDGGGSEGSDYDVGDNILIPYLLKNTNGIIDTIFISHFHEDHVEGVISVIEKLKVNKVIIGIQPQKNELYDTLLKLCDKKSIPIYTLSSGKTLIIDGVEFKAIYPGKNIEIKDDLNNNSLVLSVKAFNITMLLTGDAEEIEENELLNKYSKRSDLNVDILKVGHHGSKTSSSIEFLKAVKPKICLISCGINNKFNHPNKETIENLAQFSNYIYRTDIHGETKIRVYPNNRIVVKTFTKP